MPLNRVAFERVRKALDAFNITDGDIAGPILIRIGQEHRKQVKRNFASEGASGASGRWASLSPGYQMWKTKELGSRGKILTLKGDMKRKFTTRSSPAYIQRYVSPAVQLGAHSRKAASHFIGRVSPPMPPRDLITKSADQLSDLREVIVKWYRKERIPQIQRANAELFKGANAAAAAQAIASRVQSLQGF